MLYQNGSTFIEVLVSLCILLSLCGILATGLKTTLSAALHSESEKQNAFVYNRVKAFVQQAVDDIDTHRLPYSPRLQNADDLTFSDGTKAVVTKNPLLQPLSGTSMLTSLALNFSETHKITSSRWSDKGIELSACPISGAKKLTSEVENFVLGGADGFIEVSGIPLKDGQCFSLKTRLSKSMTFKQGKLLAPQILVPLKRHYTLYVDREFHLRYLSHRGEEVLENQPLIQGVKSFNIQTTIRESAIQKFDISLDTTFERNFKLTFTHALGVAPELNFILNGGVIRTTSVGKE